MRPANRLTLSLLHLPLIVAAFTFLSIPAFAYNEDTHFQMTYVICRSVGFTADEALIVAAADQGMDDSAGTVANGGPGGVIPNIPEEWMWHALDGYGMIGGEMKAAGILRRRDEFFYYALKEPDPRKRLILLGVFFHYQQDTWSHRHHYAEPILKGAYEPTHLSQTNYITYNTPAGHAIDIHLPDLPPFDPAAALMSLEADVVYARTFLQRALGRTPGSFLANYVPQGGKDDDNWNDPQNRRGTFFHQIDMSGAAPNSARSYLLSLIRAQIDVYSTSRARNPRYIPYFTPDEANIDQMRANLNQVAQAFEPYRSGGIQDPTIIIPTTEQKFAAGFSGLTSGEINSMLTGPVKFVAVGADKNLYQLPTLPIAAWSQIPNSGVITAITVMHNGVILGIGINKGLYTRATPISDWVEVPNSGYMVSVSIMPNGSILGVGPDGLLYTRTTLTSNWVKAPDTGGAVTSAAVMQDGSIIGIGMTQKLYRRANLDSIWVEVPNSGTTTSITVMPDGSILGVGPDKFLYRRITLNSDWIKILNSSAITGVAVLNDGSILGIGTDRGLWQMASLDTSWVPLRKDDPVTGITAMHDGTLIGIGTDKNLYARTTLAGYWVRVPNSGPVIAVGVMADGSLIGAGTDKFLYTRATLNGSWVRAPNPSGAVSSVAGMADGSVLGIGMDQMLYRRATLGSDWVKVPGSGPLISVSVMKNGMILGVSTDKALYQRANLDSNWVKIPNSGDIIGVTQKP
jgi:hypothetical protein